MSYAVFMNFTVAEVNPHVARLVEVHGAFRSAPSGIPRCPTDSRSIKWIHSTSLSRERRRILVRLNCRSIFDRKPIWIVYIDQLFYFLQESAWQSEKNVAPAFFPDRPKLKCK